MGQQKIELLIGANASQATAALNQTKSQVGSFGDTVKGVGAKMAAAFGAAAMGKFLKGTIDAAAESEANLVRLQTAVENTGNAWTEYSDVTLRKVNEMQRKTAQDDDELMNALSTLMQVTGDYDKAMELLGTTTDLAVGKQIDLKAAAELVGKVAAGNLGILSRYGIVLEKGATSTEALAMISERFAGQAEAFGQSSAGQLQLAQVQWDNVRETIGGMLLPVLGDLATTLEHIFNAWRELSPPMQKATVGITLAGAAALIASPYIGTLTGAVSWFAVSAIPAAVAGAQSLIVAFQLVGQSAGMAATQTLLAGGTISVASGGMVLAAGAAGYAIGTFGIQVLGVKDDLEAFGESLVDTSSNELTWFEEHILGVTPPVQVLSEAERSAAAAAQEQANSTMNAADAANAQQEAVEALNSALLASEDAELAYLYAQEKRDKAQSKLNDLSKEGKQGTDEYRIAELELKKATAEAEAKHEEWNAELANTKTATDKAKSATDTYQGALKRTATQASLTRVQVDKLNASISSTPARGSTAGYATGGIASGPLSGYQATLHGTEMVIPLDSYRDRALDLLRLTATALRAPTPDVGAGGVVINMGGFTGSAGDAHAIGSAARNAVLEALEMAGRPGWR